MPVPVIGGAGECSGLSRRVRGGARKRGAADGGWRTQAGLE
jgi:hypothetical protein